MQEVTLWMLIPFVVMLLMIAVAPLVAEHWWESNRNKLIFTLLLSIPTALFLTACGFGADVAHQLMFDYVPFIMLLLALFVVTGGINVTGDIAATPTTNTLLLGLGWLLASFMGTTGAAMLMIRPVLQINQQRKHKVWTVLFFIALVANCGGLLTPLGDPPLFLLYLRGASFEWFFSLVSQWAVVGIALLVIYYFVDSFQYKMEDKLSLQRDNEEKEPIRVRGSINFLYLAMVIAAVVFLNQSYIPQMGDHHAPLYLRYLREIVLLVIVLLSLYSTKKEVREANNFSWGPISEVAILFVGIFTTMTPALMYLSAHAPSLGLDAPWQFYYSTGLLSSFLDNAPTAVAFHTVATGLPMVEGTTLVAGIPEVLLKAIALGAVFFGAMTYIGNGPNFMVKAIAEQEGISMPSFFGYIFKFSLVVLLPVYVVVQFIFF